MERMMGLEPTTSALARQRSSQLNYIRIFLVPKAGIEPARGLSHGRF